MTWRITLSPRPQERK